MSGWEAALGLAVAVAVVVYLLYALLGAEKL